MENQDNQQAEEQQNQQATEQTPESVETASATDATEQKEELSETEKLQKQLDELNDKYLRTRAEYDNFRRRTAKERQDYIKSAGSDIIEGLLPVIDDFERALAHIAEAQDVNSLKEGVDLIYKKFNDFLTKRGVSVIETKGLPLDTNVHEAITMMPAPTPDMAGKIFDCVEKGYKLGDKVIRFAKVVVCQ